MASTEYESPLHRMVRTTPTEFWNDSCDPGELAYAVEHGATGATTNPSIVLDVLRREWPLWRERIGALARENPEATEADLAWRVVEEMAVRAAALLRPEHARTGGRRGRVSIQTDPMLYRSAPALLQQALRFHGLAPNAQVKIPATKAGVEAIEEATASGVSVNATVSFTVSQAIAVAEAVERGAARAANPGALAPVCTIMVGRLEDWLHVVSERDGIAADPRCNPLAGVACFKKALELYKARGYRTTLLAAAYRHRLHWTELVGGEVILTMPSAWQKRFNASEWDGRSRVDEPVPESVVTELLARFPDFRRAWEERGLEPADFDAFPPTRRTLRTFARAVQDLQSAVRDAMLPDPDRSAS